MTRARIGLLLIVFVLLGCDHHKRPAPTSNGAAVAQPPSDAEYTGQPPAYPRATLVSPPPPAPAPTKNSAPPTVATTAPTEPPPSPPPAPIATTPPDATPSNEPPPAPVAPATNSPDMTRLDMTPPTPPVAPAPLINMDDDEAKKQVVVLTTSFGRIVIQLDDVSAPRTCGNFRKLVSDGFYNHTTFHRVIPNFIIQGGDPNSKSDDRSSYGQGDPGYTLPAEIKLKAVAGAVAMARLANSANPQRDSNGSQFFICVTSNPSLDGQYTVFGHVIEGMDTVAKIASQDRDSRDNPTSRIEMEAILEPKKQALEDGATGR